MSELTNPATGHVVRTDEASVAFWEVVGYRSPAKKTGAKKAPAEKAAFTKSSE